MLAGTVIVWQVCGTLREPGGLHSFSKTSVLLLSLKNPIGLLAPLKHLIEYQNHFAFCLLYDKLA